MLVIVIGTFSFISLFLLLCAIFQHCTTLSYALIVLMNIDILFAVTHAFLCFLSGMSLVQTKKNTYFIPLSLSSKMNLNLPCNSLIVSQLGYLIG